MTNLQDAAKLLELHRARRRSHVFFWVGVAVGFGLAALAVAELEEERRRRRGRRVQVFYFPDVRDTSTPAEPTAFPQAPAEG